VLHSYCWDPDAANRGEDKPLKKFEHIADALRYAIYSAFPTGEFNNPDDMLTIDQIRRNVYGSGDEFYTSNMLGIGQGGYF